MRQDSEYYRALSYNILKNKFNKKIKMLLIRTFILEKKAYWQNVLLATANEAIVDQDGKETLASIIRRIRGVKRLKLIFRQRQG